MPDLRHILTLEYLVSAERLCQNTVTLFIDYVNA